MFWRDALKQRLTRPAKTKTETPVLVPLADLQRAAAGGCTAFIDRDDPAAEVVPRGRRFDGLHQAAGALKIPVAELRALKKLGCTAFKNGRVDEGPLATVRRGTRWCGRTLTWFFVFDGDYLDLSPEQRAVFSL